MVPFLLHHIVRLRSPDLFIIFVVLMSLGTAWLTSQFGLSLALGAFIAGMVLSESEYSHQIVADILPFRDVFNSVFFVSIGMLLSLGALASDLPVVLAWVGSLVVGKALLVLLVVRLLGYSLRVATMTGFGLAQVGEFSFILPKAGLPEGLLSEADYQSFLAASILSMIATPFLIKAAPRVGYAPSPLRSPARCLSRRSPGFNLDEPDLSGHVVIVGYGLNGRNLARVLRKVKRPVPGAGAERARSCERPAARGERIIYGDATRKEVLHHVGLERARILVLAISDPMATRHAVWLARQMNPGHPHHRPHPLHVGDARPAPTRRRRRHPRRVRDEHRNLLARPAASTAIARDVIQRQVAEVRREGYEMLRTPSLPPVEMSDIAEALGSASTETLFVDPDSPAVGKTIGDLRLRSRTGATVIAVVRDGRTDINPGPEQSCTPKTYWCCSEAPSR